MAKNKSFTGNRKAVGTPTIGKEAMMQLIRMSREANKATAKFSKEEDKSGTDSR